MRDEELASEAKRLIGALAVTPRFAGSAEEKRARDLCAAELRALGLAVVEKPFQFSEWPGRWGIPLISGWMLASFLMMVLATRYVDPVTAMDALVWPIVAGQVWAVKRRPKATAKMKWLRSSSVNLEATRGAPKIWLVAHLDSKSQSIPMLLRVASHIALLGVIATAVALGFLEQWGAVHGIRWNVFGILALLSALPSLLCIVGNGSRGALDNASGVAAVLIAARLISSARNVGVLLTSGEELDLAGARAWAAEPPPGAMLINCDTVDDEGGWRLMYVNHPHALDMASQRAAKKLGLPLRMGRVIPGIITDSHAFETAGLPSVTLSRGTVRTLARLHTAGDNPNRLSGFGAATAARILAQMVEELS